MQSHRLLLASGLLAALAACATPHRRSPAVDLGSTTDLGSSDMQVADAGGEDAGPDDAGVEQPDLGVDDAGLDGGPPDLGFDAGRPDLGFDAGRPDLGVDGGMTGAGLLLLSEIASGGPGGSSDEFIEIYNPGSTAVDASSLRIEYRSATGAAYSVIATLPTGTAISAHRYFLVAGTGYLGSTPPDVPAAFTDALAGFGGHVRLTTLAGAELDRCGWGSAVAPEGTAAPGALAGLQSRERKAFATSTPTSMALGGADALRGNARDSNDNGADFLVRETAEPQNSASLEVP